MWSGIQTPLWRGHFQAYSFGRLNEEHSAQLLQGESRRCYDRNHDDGDWNEMVVRRGLRSGRNSRSNRLNRAGEGVLLPGVGGLEPVSGAIGSLQPFCATVSCKCLSTKLLAAGVIDRQPLRVPSPRIVRPYDDEGKLGDASHSSPP